MVGLRSDNEGRQGYRLLEKWKVVFAFDHVSRQIRLLGVANNANDGSPGRARAKAHVLAHRIFIGPVFAGQRLIDDDNGLGVPLILIGERPAVPEWNFQRREIVGTDETNISVRPRISWGRWSAFNSKRRGAALSAERNGQAGCNRSYT